MYGQQPYFYQRAMPQYDYGPQLKGRFVSSFDEAKASQIDFDGSMFVFPDVANKRIYTKQINMDGTASLNMYVLSENIPTTPQMTNDFVTRNEFSTVIEEIKTLIESSGGKNGKSSNAKRNVPTADEFSTF